MGHRAGVYMVRVRPKRDKEAWRLLGDIDESGTRLIDVLHGCMDGFEATTEDGTKSVGCLGSELDDQELRLNLHHGQNGVAADIVDQRGELRIHQDPQDTQLLRCACLFQLEPNQRLGWLAVHVNNGRGVKGLLDKGLQERFHTAHDDLVLSITPWVEGAVLRAAVNDNRVEKVKLIRVMKPEDRAYAAVEKWVPGNAIGKIELDISIKGEGQRIVTRLLRDFLGGDKDAFGQIVAFEGLTFTEAKVEVSVEGSRRRTFNIEHPDAGHPMTEDLHDLVMDENGEPTDESLFAALRRALGLVRA